MRSFLAHSLFALVLAGVVLGELHAGAYPATPDGLKVRVKRDGFELSFWWNTPPRFSKTEAVEFEVLIDTAPRQKCFAQPIGGKDNQTAYAESNIPGNYTDVWNYAAPTTFEAITELANECGPCIAPTGLVADLYTPDRVASFAIGTKIANTLDRSIIRGPKAPEPPAGVTEAGEPA